MLKAKRTNAFTLPFCFDDKINRMLTALNSQSLASLRPSVLYNATTARGTHSFTKAMSSFTFFIMRTIGCVCHYSLLNMLYAQLIHIPCEFRLNILLIEF